MKIIRFIDPEGIIRLGTSPDGETVIEVVSPPDTMGFEITGKRYTIAKKLPPLQPAAIMCIGLNYGAHARETGMALPKHPVLFMKNPASVTGHNDPVILPASCRIKPQVDYEAELAVVIGKAAKNVKAENAADYIKGYTIANDISARSWQKHAGGGQWVKGKSFDTFCPLGPWLVTPDEIPDPGTLDISCTLNGHIMQQSNTSDMLYTIPHLIEFLSEDTTLLPDTLILTGTPEGVGFIRTPPVFLAPGDLLQTTIEKIGTLENHVM